MLLPSLLFSLLAALAMRAYARRNPASDPRFTLAILTLLVILPLLSLLPKLTLAVPAISTPSSAPASAFSLAPALWFAGFLVFSLRGLRDLRALRRWSRRARPADDLPAFRETLAELGVTRPIRLRFHPELDSPVVSGLTRPCIDLPESARSWPEQTLKMALLHELAHIQRRDLWMAALAHLACLLHWFNPAVWWLRRTMLTQCEFACDAHLLRKGADPRAYAHALCDVARSAAAPPLSLAMAGHAPLRERILFLSRGPGRRSLILPALILATATSAIAMSLVRFSPNVPLAPPTDGPEATETELRFTADPFPAD